MPLFEGKTSRIYYEEVGSGFPLLIIPGGGLNATVENFFRGDGPFGAPFDALGEFSSEYRCITFDMRNAPTGQSEGPLEAQRPWDAFIDDQLALMDHLGCEKFLVMGFCMGGPLIWKLLSRAADRVVAAVISQPAGVRAEAPTSFYDRNMKDWGPKLCAQRQDIRLGEVETYLRTMALDKDFVYTVDRDFVRSCNTPILVMPDESPAHPYSVAIESARLAPRAEVCLFPWKDSKENTELAVRHVRTFLKAYKPAQHEQGSRHHE